MKIALTGSSGFVGSALMDHWRAAGHEVLKIVRRPIDAPPRVGEIHWEPEQGRLDTGRLAGVQVVAHLAGENIAGLWTPSKKRRIRNSRVVGTQALCEALAAMADRPGTLLAASAVGYYGSRADQTLTEESSAGEGFLADVCRQWEAATDPARQVGIRVVNLRLGVVLSARDGALRKMLGPFKLGLGGRVGHGRQWMSWVVLEDVVRAFDRAMGQAGLSGPVNVCSPQPVTNAGFTRALGRALHRPTMLPVPAWVVGALLGQMGRETLLSSARVLPARLTAAGFTFKHEQIDEALGAAIRS